jgi:integrase
MTPLRDALKQYVALRRALGTRLEEPAKTLGDFVTFLNRIGAEFITSDLALRWSMKPKGVQQATWARRLSMVRGFAAWLSMVDSRTQVPASRLLPARRRRPKPHIFTKEEIGRLMVQAARLSEPRGPRALTHVTLIGLLCATGLRPAEALALDRADVDLKNGVLSIRQTKFGKSRFVPVSESTRSALAQYAKKRDEIWPQRRTAAAFFISGRGTRLQASTARRTFARISCTIGLRPPSQGRITGRGPRLQDFRHSFATRRLIDWYRTGLDVGQELPKLATYLGHVDVNHTYWYIEAVPELLQLATDRLNGCQRGHRPRGEQ